MESSAKESEREGKPYRMKKNECRIEISKLGPIDEFKMSLDGSINIVIGPQASGKSTIGKAIYFCKKIKDYYIDFIMQDSIFLSTHPNELYISFLKYIRKNFMGCFGTTKHMASFFVTYYYDNKKCVTIRLNQGYAIFKFSNEMEASLKSSFHNAYEIYKENMSSSRYDFMANFNSKLRLKEEMQQHFLKLAAELFCTEEDVLYIPAGRSLLSVLADQMDTIDITVLDLAMKDFIERIRLTKTKFGAKLDTIVEDYLKTVRGQIKNVDIALAKSLIQHILKADYVNDSDGEKLYFDSHHWIKLMFGSSGQQESLWILLLLFLIILENKKTFVILEEPEAHLYPVAQKYMMELISLTANSSGSQVFITTHSPYILSSANLLIQSGIVENNPQVFNEEIVIKRQFRILPKKVRAYKIQEGVPFRCDSIIDEETGMINSLEIDTVSEIINQEAEKLENLEIKYDL